MKSSEVVVGLHGKVAVTLTGVGDDLGVIERRTVRSRTSQPYHDAGELPLAAAQKLIDKALVDATKLATKDLRQLFDDLKKQGLTVAAAGVVFHDYRLPSSLAATLRNHTACHAGEGQMTQESLLGACEALGWPVTTVLRSDGADARTERVGKLIGPPWQKDHKLAATAALHAAGL
jgi:hypothetical protein